MTIQFQKAERSQVKLKVGIQGPSGSGKTMGSLSLATALAKAEGGRIALIDSERKRSSYYADRYDFDSIELTDHKPERYIEAITAAYEAGYPVCVIDSLAHAWQTILNEKDDYDRANPRSNQWTNWRIYGPRWEKLVKHILHTPIHVIATMRSKQAYEQTEQNGKKQVVKIGLQPEVRTGSEYELALVFDVSMTHKAEASKDNTNLFDGKQVDLCSNEVSTALLNWLSTAKPAEPAVVIPEPTKEPVATADQLEALRALATTAEEMQKLESRIAKGMTLKQADKMIAAIQARPTTTGATA